MYGVTTSTYEFGGEGITVQSITLGKGRWNEIRWHKVQLKENK